MHIHELPQFHLVPKAFAGAHPCCVLSTYQHLAVQRAIRKDQAKKRTHSTLTYFKAFQSKSSYHRSEQDNVKTTIPIPKFGPSIFKPSIVVCDGMSTTIWHQRVDRIHLDTTLGEHVTSILLQRGCDHYNQWVFGSG